MRASAKLTDAAKHRTQNALDAHIYAFFLAFPPRDAMVAGMRAEYDQNGKQMLREMLEGHSTVEAQVEVPQEARYVDLSAAPIPGAAPVPDHFGFLGRLARGAVTFEFFHNTPSGPELRLCLIKHGELCLSLSRRKELPPIPIQWVISSGRPNDGISTTRASWS